MSKQSPFYICHDKLHMRNQWSESPLDFADELMVSGLVAQNQLEQMCRSCDEGSCLQSASPAPVYVVTG